MSCKFRGQKYVRARLNMDPIFNKFRRQLLNICTKLYVFFLTFLRHRDDDNTGNSQGNESDGEKVGSDDERAVNWDVSSKGKRVYNNISDRQKKLLVECL